jgi:hypothetical protein
LGRALPTLTSDQRLETRQYELMGIDLGEGVRRRALVVAMVFLAAWIAALMAIGVPLHIKLALLYVGPPLLLASRGLQPDESERRQVIDHWMCGARFLALDQWCPLVGLSSFRAERPGTVLVSTRVQPGGSRRHRRSGRVA